MKWQETSFEVPSMDTKVRWIITPNNKLTRLLWRFLGFAVTVDWVHLIMSKTKKELEED